MAGNLFCAHMVAFLLVLAVLLDQANLAHADVVAFMPMPVKSAQSLPVAFQQVYADGVDEVHVASCLSKLFRKASKRKAPEPHDDDAAKDDLADHAEDRAADAAAAEDVADDVREALQPRYSAPNTTIVSDAVDYAQQRMADKASGAGDGTGRLIPEATILDYAQVLVAEGHPLSTTQKTLRELTTFQLYWAAYEAGELEHDLVWFYLSQHIGWINDWVRMIQDGGGVVLGAALRLAKFPPGWIILADRGFAYDALKYPNFNAHSTPAFLSARDQFTQEELEADVVLCTLRYSIETNFARLTRFSTLADVNPREYFSILQDIVDTGYGDANFLQPFHDVNSYN